jgi:hypothetical protein
MVLERRTLYFCGQMAAYQCRTNLPLPAGLPCGLTLFILPKPGVKRVLPSEQSEKWTFVPLGREGIMGEVMRGLLEPRR